METPAQKRARKINWQLYRLASIVTTIQDIQKGLEPAHSACNFDLTIALARAKNALDYIKENR